MATVVVATVVDMVVDSEAVGSEVEQEEGKVVQEGLVATAVVVVVTVEVEKVEGLEEV